MKNKTYPLHYQYVERLFCTETELMIEARENAKLLDAEGLPISPIEGRLLEFLVRLKNVKKIIEIGTLTGYSTLWLEKGLPKDGQIWTLESQERNIHLCQMLFNKLPYPQKINLVPGKAIDSLQRLSSLGPFDLIFIDADKISYCLYLDWAEKNIKSGGLVIGDNTFMFGHVYANETDTKKRIQEKIKVIDEFNLRLSNPKQFNSILIPTIDGLTVAEKL